MVKAITSTAEFNELINSGKRVIVDFHAVWCGPCKVISPKFETFSKDYNPESENPNKDDEIVFVKVDVDELPDVSATAGIRAMPTFQTYKNGQKVGELLGADVAKLKKLIEDIKA
ncbi:Cytoplasmic thioredoxin isoenzyme 2 [Dissophora globulifera]|nr:Cytoplasmic thioredoxin isoenzyme 2 [Dissophora globulifera]